MVAGAGRPVLRHAIRHWLADAGRGAVVLPTGAGKTVVAFMALAEVPVRTLVIVPTIELLRQWRAGPGDLTRARTVLGYEPRYTLEQGLAD